MNLVSVSLSVCVAPSPNFFLFISLAPSLPLLSGGDPVSFSHSHARPPPTHTHTHTHQTLVLLFCVSLQPCFVVCSPCSQISRCLFISSPSPPCLLSPFSISLCLFLSLPLSFYVISCPSCSIISLSEVVLTSTIRLHIHWWTDRWTGRESDRQRDGWILVKMLHFVCPIVWCSYIVFDRKPSSKFRHNDKFKMFFKVAQYLYSPAYHC